MIRPMRIFQHQEGRFLCRADRGCKPESRRCVGHLGVRRSFIALQNLSRRPQQNL